MHKAFASADPSAQKVKNFLNGTWLGHPLHVILTDVPIGAWTTALVFDALELVSGRDEFATAATDTCFLSFGSCFQRPRKFLVIDQYEQIRQDAGLYICGFLRVHAKAHV